ncbi:MAG TPA: response regulator, partial [bacterium]|nr:response regulator [bacterium]
MSTPRSKSRQVEILLVEDNVADLLLMMKFLKESAVQSNVSVARDGQMAMDYLKRVNGFENAVRPDLVLLDLGLPYKDGHEVLSEIKQETSLNSIPIIVLTSSNAPKDAIDAYIEKADYYMVKPHDLKQYAASMKYLEEFWL